MAKPGKVNPFGEAKARDENTYLKKKIVSFFFIPEIFIQKKLIFERERKRMNE